MLAPKGNLEKIVNVTMRAFVLSAILSPLLLGVEIEFEEYDHLNFAVEDYTYEFETEMSEMVERELSQQIELLISNKLSEIDVYPQKIEVTVESIKTNTAEIVTAIIDLGENYKIKDTDIRYKISGIVDCPIILNYEKG